MSHFYYSHVIQNDCSTKNILFLQWPSADKWFVIASLVDMLFHPQSRKTNWMGRLFSLWPTWDYSHPLDL